MADTLPLSPKHKSDNFGIAWLKDIKLTIEKEENGKDAMSGQKESQSLKSKAKQSRVTADNTFAISSCSPKGVYGLFFPNELVSFSIEHNLFQKPGCVLKVEVRDFFGKRLYSANENLHSGKRLLSIPAQKKLGFYSVRLKLERDGEAVQDIARSFCVVNLPPKKNDPFFATCAWRFGYMHNAMKLIGMGSAWISSSWRGESETGDINFTGMDKECDTLTKAGFEVMCFQFLVHPDYRGLTLPDWEKKRIKERIAKSENPYPDEHFKAFSRYTEKIASHYKGKIRIWYGWDEMQGMRTNPDKTLDYYTKRMKAFTEGVKKADPDNIIAGIGLARHGSDSYGKRVYKSVHTYITQFWPHLYPNPRTVGKGAQIPEEFLRKSFLHALEVMKPYGIKTLGTSEWGDGVIPVPIDSDVEKDLARLTARGLIITRSVEEIKHLCLFTVMKFKDGAGCCGLWDNKGNGSIKDHVKQTPTSAYWPKPVAAAYSTVAHFPIAITSMTSQPRIHKCVYAYAFEKKTGKWIVPIWTTLKSDVPFAFTARMPVRVFDLMGNLIHEYQPGKVALVLTDNPLFIVADGEEVVRDLERGVAEISSLALNLRFKNLDTLVVDVLNQTTRKRKAKVELMPNTLTKGMTKETALNPFEQVQVKIDLGDVDYEKLNGQVLRVVESTDDGPGSSAFMRVNIVGVQNISKLPITVDGDLSEYQASKPLVFNDTDSLRPTADVAPGGLWRGASDLSMRTWFAWDADNLYIAAEVTDDTHIQKGGRYGVNWAQDCIAFGIDTGNDTINPAFSKKTGMDGNDYEFYFGLTSNGIKSYCHPFAPRPDKRLKNVRMAIVQKGKILNYEISIPWENLSSDKPAPEMMFKANILCMDADYAKDHAAYWMSLTTGIHTGGKDPSKYAPFVLLP